MEGLLWEFLNNCLAIDSLIWLKSFLLVLFLDNSLSSLVNKSVIIVSYFPVFIDELNSDSISLFIVFDNDKFSKAFDSFCDKI